VLGCAVLGWDEWAGLLGWAALGWAALGCWAAGLGCAGLLGCWAAGLGCAAVGWATLCCWAALGRTLYLGEGYSVTLARGHLLLGHLR
jgi:hypothetical protein